MIEDSSKEEETREVVNKTLAAAIEERLVSFRSEYERYRAAPEEGTQGLSKDTEKDEILGLLLDKADELDEMLQVMKLRSEGAPEYQPLILSVEEHLAAFEKEVRDSLLL